jgi:flagellar biogenesis protein FliO
MEKWLMVLIASVLFGDPTEQLPAIHTSAFQYIEVILALAGVLVLAYLTLRIGLPRVFGMRASANGPIQVVARYPLEPRKTLYLVKAGSQMFLIGTSENQVEYLTTVAQENADEIVGSARREELQPPRKDFRQYLNWF